MLRHLLIENYALIQKLDINFNSGLTVITGETGAGKSIILGALGLILGQRADTSVLLDKKSKCVVEGDFLIKGYKLNDFFEANNLDADDNCLLRREINPAGKSRAFINDTPVSLNQLKALGDQLVDIHSQHENLLVKDTSFQLDVLDHFARHFDTLSAYTSLFREMKRLKQNRSEIYSRQQQAKLDQDYFSFLQNELEQAALKEGEQELLERELALLTHAGDFKSALVNARHILEEQQPNLLDLMSELCSKISLAAQYQHLLSELETRLKSLTIEMKDIAGDIIRADENINLDPSRIEQLSQRLDLIYNLEKKHRVNSLDELLQTRNDLQIKLESIAKLDEDLEILDKEIESKAQELDELAHQISLGRIQAIPEVTNKLTALLIQMGMPHARFEVVHEPLAELNLQGADFVRFTFSANKGGEMKEISRVASGGELSRLMLGLKSIISKQKLVPTQIFDEIDLGVSGEVADKVGNILKQLSAERQLLAITHLPQIAGKGDQHLFVYKSDEGVTTKTHLSHLSAEERIAEIAKMISGESVSQAAIQTAKELLSNN